MGRSRTAVGLQVRLASSRLPEKALLTLGGKTVVEHAMSRLARVPVDEYWVLTDPESLPALRGPAEACGFSIYAGDPRDVLKRYCHCAREQGWETIIRATGDNPLVSWELARDALALREERDADYAGYTGSPLGTGVEVVRTAALEAVLSFSRDPYDHEHVTPGIYRNPERFCVALEPVVNELLLPDASVTLDTMEDYQFLTGVFEELSARNQDADTATVSEVVRILRGQQRRG